MNNKRSVRTLPWRALLPSITIGVLLGALPAMAIADDFDNDSTWDSDDIDLLVGQIISGVYNPDFDLNDDNFVDTTDLWIWRWIGGVGNGFIRQYEVCDVDLNGIVDSADIEIVEANSSAGASPNTWSGGDFNADGVVDDVDRGYCDETNGIVLPTVVPGAVLWAPLTMDFGIVQQGGNADQTLTLTNNADEGTLIISNIHFTFNQQGAFSISPFIPTDLEPGESMAVELTFAPNDISFFMADLRITSNATNAPVLTYSVLGMGDFTVVCGEPYTDCSGFCTLLSDDVNNCGSCGNVCSIPLNATPFCDAGSCDFVCDPGYVVDGDGCSPIGGPIEFDIDAPGAIYGASSGRTPIHFPIEAHLLNSVFCGPGMATPQRINPADLDGDGIEDGATVLVRTSDLSLDCSTSTLICEGMLTDGTSFVGTSNPITVVRSGSGERCRR